jgi:hypothetical protein
MSTPDYSIISLTRSGKDCTGIRFKFCPSTTIREKLVLAGFQWDRDSRLWIIHCILEPYKIYSLMEDWPDN